MSIHPEIEHLKKTGKVLTVNKPVDSPLLPESYCHQCHRVTETVFLPLSSGHTGNCCAECRATRKGHPFISKKQAESLNTPMSNRTAGEEHATVRKR